MAALFTGIQSSKLSSVSLQDRAQLINELVGKDARDSPNLDGRKKCLNLAQVLEEVET